MILWREVDDLQFLILILNKLYTCKITIKCTASVQITTRKMYHLLPKQPLSTPEGHRIPKTSKASKNRLLPGKDKSRTHNPSQNKNSSSSNSQNVCPSNLLTENYPTPVPPKIVSKTSPYWITSFYVRKTPKSLKTLSNRMELAIQWKNQSIRVSFRACRFWEREDSAGSWRLSTSRQGRCLPWRRCPKQCNLFNLSRIITKKSIQSVLNER